VTASEIATVAAGTDARDSAGRDIGVAFADIAGRPDRHRRS
jgi:hypothetical protein